MSNPKVVEVDADEIVAYLQEHLFPNLSPSLIRLLTVNASGADVYQYATEAGQDVENLQFVVLQVHELAHRELREAGITDYDEQHRIMHAIGDAAKAFVQVRLSSGGTGVREKRVQTSKES